MRWCPLKNEMGEIKIHLPITNYYYLLYSMVMKVWNVVSYCVCTIKVTLDEVHYDNF